MSQPRKCLFCLVVSGLLALVTLIPLGALEVFEFKSVDVRFWLRERLLDPEPRTFVRALFLDGPLQHGGPPSAGATAQRPPGLDGLLASTGTARVIGVEMPPVSRAVGAPIDFALGAGTMLPPDRLVVGIPAGLPEHALPGQPRVPEVPAGVFVDPGRTATPPRASGGTGHEAPVPRAGRSAFGFDYDGVVRRVPLLVEHEGTFQPAFVLQLVCAYDGVALEDIRVHRGEFIELFREGELIRRIPIDSQLRLLVNYRQRPPGSSLRWSALARAHEGADPSALDDLVAERVVIVVAGSPDQVGLNSIPLATVASDVEITAEAVETILTESYIRRISSLGQFFLTWALLFLGSLVMVRLRSWRGVVAGFTLMLLYIVAEKLAFLIGNVWLDFFLPLVALQAGVAVFPVYSYRGRTHGLLDEMRLLRRFDDLVLMNMASGLIVAGRHGMVVRHNPRAAELLGLRGESLHGRHIRELFAVSPGMLELLGQAIAATEDASETKTLPISSRVAMPGRQDGEGTVLEMEVALVDPQLLASREHTNLPCYVLTFDDVTDEVQRAEEDQRRARLAAMGEIAAKLGHEIRNSLGGLRLYVENVRDEIAPDGSGARAIEAMIREIKSLYRKIDELREYGHDPQLELSSCDIKDLLEEALAYSSQKLGEKHVRAVLDCERLPPVDVDRRQLREAFQNLINNAIEAAPEGGRVAITAERLQIANGAPAGSYAIHVEDNGPGIDPDLKEQVFALFFTTKPDIGTGLGLPMVKKIVESHGGQVSFRCDAEYGTRFTVTLPARPRAGEE